MEVFEKACPSEASARAERHGLEEISKYKILNTPRLLEQKGARLRMQKIKRGSASSQAYANFGKLLAKFHRASIQPIFGFETDNFCGRSLQKNTEHRSNWADFFWFNRIGFQLNLAKRNQQITTGELRLIEDKEKEFREILPKKVDASLCHGDLWAGNLLFDQNQKHYVIDPAIYYGDRESDLAMAALFGGFDAGFFEAYEDEFPLREQWRRRRDFYQLYHLLNHLNLFGRSYWPQIEKKLSQGCLQ